jgi:hypothetical protein
VKGVKCIIHILLLFYLFSGLCKNDNIHRMGGWSPGRRVTQGRGLLVVQLNNSYFISGFVSASLSSCNEMQALTAL